ncbi:hypothetical protein MBLNU13_g00915t2 [Cladosporium sp. NU13]
MRHPKIWLHCLVALGVGAQQSTDSSSSTGSTASSSFSSSTQSSSEASPFSYTNSFSIIGSTVPESEFTGSQYTYVTYNGQSEVTATSTLSSDTASALSGSQSIQTSRQQNVTQITGGSSRTASSTTSSAPLATNTVPCNNYPEFCSRKYSNITEVCAHNSAFSIKDNAASNQVLSIVDQLNDGVRMIQGEVHWVNNTMYSCHTSCDLLNAGTYESELEIVADWLRDHPYDVVTVLIVNSDLTTVENFVPAIQNSGIAEYLYTPKYIPQHKDQWPTLSEMILNNERAVVFMDYNANQTAVPYILDEFTHMWETPFSPQDPAFPCTIQRPPGLDPKDARENYMYLANHNLNLAVDVSAILGNNDGQTVLIPNTADINRTNGEYDTYGQLEEMTSNCSATWGVPPNFLLVDYYNYGDPKPGSVFEVAARWNNVTYNRPCCGSKGNTGFVSRASPMAIYVAVALIVIFLQQL